MSTDLNAITEHDLSDDCPVCRAQEFAELVLLPAASAWEATSGLPRFSIALHGAASLLGAMLQEGVSRQEIDAAMAVLLDELELQISEHDALGGPTQGSA